METFIGQVNGPFWLPCHSCVNYDDPNWKTDYSKPQCCGAAMMRSLGWFWGTEPGTGKLAIKPHDPTIVFNSHAEFMAHHERISVEDARVRLILDSANYYTLRELQKQQVRFIKP